MKLFIKIMPLLLLPVFTLAQLKPYWQEPTRLQADSLQYALQHTNNDTLRMYICWKLGVYYSDINQASSLDYHQQQLSLAQQLKLRLWEAEAFNRIGYAAFHLVNNPKSIQPFLEAVKIAGSPESEKNIWGIAVFSKEKNPRVARLTVLGNIYNNMGVLYYLKGDIRKSTASFAESQKIAKSIDEEVVLSLAYLNLGGAMHPLEAHANQQQLDSALVNEKKALIYSNTSGYIKYRGLILSSIAKVYIQKGEYDSAKQYFAQSIQTYREQNNLLFLSAAYPRLADLYINTGIIDSGLLYTKKGLEILQAMGSPPGAMADLYTSLSSIYRLQNNKDSAFFYSQLAIALKDSLNEVEKTKPSGNAVTDMQLNSVIPDAEKIQAEKNSSTYPLLAVIAVCMGVGFLVFRNYRNQKRANERIEAQESKLQSTASELKSIQLLLFQSEKMAMLGEFAAGSAPGIQTPLNYVHDSLEANKELVVKIKEEIDKANIGEAKALADEVIQNQDKINQQGELANAIVKDMLQHSQPAVAQKEATNINALVDEYFRLARHVFKARNNSMPDGQPPFHPIVRTDYDESIGNINIVPQDIGRVLLYLIDNALYAVTEKKQLLNLLATVATNPAQMEYDPIVSLTTKRINTPLPGVGDSVLISVKDNGNGVRHEILDKIFQPFFTTKPNGQSTGLGLSLSQEIIKAYGGEIKVNSNEGDGAQFIIQLPIT